jgi:ATP-binding protein involved in chromosome partitioning
METKLEEQQVKINERMSRIKHKIVVMSGKGGVGKTTVSVNLAYALSLAGNKVGLLDIDLHGPNAAKMLGLEGRILSSHNDEIEPLEALHGLKVVSMALLMERTDEPVIWRGPLKTGAINQFLSDVRWGDLDYLIVDSPPGTGDELISICQSITDLDGAVVVTTPQDVAVLDSTKSVMFAKTLNIPVIGIIENMSGFICPHCKKEIALFGRNGGEKAARNLKVPFLGRIPLKPEIVKSGDSGEPFILFKNQVEAISVMNEISKKITEGN